MPTCSIPLCRTSGYCFAIVELDELGEIIMTAGCMKREGSEFQCRVRWKIMSVVLVLFNHFFFFEEMYRFVCANMEEEG